MYLREATKPMGAKMPAGLTHRIGFHMKSASFKFGARDHHGGDNAAAVDRNAIEVADLLNPPLFSGKFSEHACPEILRNCDHAAGLR